MKFEFSDTAPSVVQKLLMKWMNTFMTMMVISSVVAIVLWNTVAYIGWRFENGF